eukprot:CCRYP_001617-RA/>CCRYP_001617-RA protein AED:0.56 eAED:0.95 QI:0/0/0/1/0/0/2/0/59
MKHSFISKLDAVSLQNSESVYNPYSDLSPLMQLSSSWGNIFILQKSTKRTKMKALLLHH